MFTICLIKERYNMNNLTLAIIFSIPFALSLNMIFLPLSAKFNISLIRFTPFPILIMLTKQHGNLLFLISMLVYAYMVIISEHNRVKDQFSSYTG